MLLFQQFIIQCYGVFLGYVKAWSGMAGYDPDYFPFVITIMAQFPVQLQDFGMESTLGSVAGEPLPVVVDYMQVLPGMEVKGRCRFQNGFLSYFISRNIS
jgi:hypothetical protein